MKIKVVYLGSIKYLTEKEMEHINVPQHFTLSECLIFLKKTYPKIENQIFKTALNLNIENENKILNENDEIAILPAFAGG